VGRIAGTFGIRGELKCDPTIPGRIVFSAGVELTCERRGEPSSTVRIESVRPHQERLLIRIAGVGDPDAAKAYAGALLRAPRDWIDLEPGEFLDDDLAGCRVVGVDGRDYGTVGAVEHYPANDMLLVGKTLVPMVAAYVRDIDVEGGRIVIDPPPGLFDDADAI
jgi:16S rRNA processing protein RimM